MSDRPTRYALRHVDGRKWWCRRGSQPDDWMYDHAELFRRSFIVPPETLPGLLRLDRETLEYRDDAGTVQARAVAVGRSR